MRAAEIGDLKTIHDSVVVDSQIKRTFWTPTAEEGH